MSANVLLYKIALLFYLVATILFFVDVIGRKENIGKIGRWVLFGGFVIHCAALVARYVEAGYTPVANLHESLSFFVLSIVGIFLLFDLRYRLTVLAAFVCPLALVLMIVGGAVPKAVRELNPMLDSWWFPVHVTLAFLGNAVFAVAFMAGIMYLLQERMLKSKKFSSLYFRLPSLGTLDAINYKCLTFGFPLMTMGIISGAMWANSAWGTYWSWDPKETWALITWFLYAALLHGRLTVGWRGRRAAIFAIIGFLCLLFMFLGVNLFLSDLHSFRALEGR
ncbi:c-type cytochrome biogenesis protein CcsB [Desulfuromonas sp. KJ2020]|jgi:cytochrome c-type biogenesis protein CcsB|uniref:c-type cytochrome biogenesis protein CcsB n=1 Tax=Desulfuromonas sp. KJ2020 TaxID=2919173 RepID=UPI0003234985|nr:c-type cytochrome biogenesis protein CcsB [Desulfuromonas sp. KJ2020]MCP3176453.1 c-type cytochrome biogenesis protein CcsB [Desulfuromonas sp. KJ2020]